MPALRWTISLSVLVPGMVIASGSMIPLATRLARLCRVFAIDLPGYG
jgi:hypothetical protein